LNDPRLPFGQIKIKIGLKHIDPDISIFTEAILTKAYLSKTDLSESLSHAVYLGIYFKKLYLLEVLSSKHIVFVFSPKPYFFYPFHPNPTFKPLTFLSNQWNLKCPNWKVLIKVWN